MKKLVLLMLILPGWIGLQAQKPFSLEEAVNYALDHNRSLKAARYDADKSKSAYKENKAGWMPQVEATVDYSYYFGYEMEFDLTSGTDYDFTPTDYTNATAAGSAAAAKYVPAGTFDPAQYVGGKAYETSLMSLLPPTVIDMGSTSTATVSLGQVLFNGQLLVGIRAAKKGMELAEKNIELSELDVRESVANVYYSVLVLEGTSAVLDESLKEMRSLIKRTESLVSVGMLETTELDQLQVQLMNLKNSQLAMDRNIQITYNLLRFHLGLKVNEPIVLTDDLDNIMSVLSEENMLTQEMDLNSNVSYQLMDKQVELSEEMVDMQKMAYAPSLTGFYAYNAKLLVSGFDMTPPHMVGASLNIPIFSSGSRKQKVKQSELDLMKAENSREIVKDNLQMQEAQLRLTYMSKFEEYKNRKENVTVSRRVYDSYEHKFSQGTVSGMELTQANNSYLQAQSSFLSSELSLLQARVAFLKMLNTL